MSVSEVRQDVRMSPVVFEVSTLQPWKGQGSTEKGRVAGRGRDDLAGLRMDDGWNSGMVGVD